MLRGAAARSSSQYRVQRGAERSVTAQSALTVAAVLIGVAGLIALVHVVEWPLRRGASDVPIVRAQQAVRRYSLLVGGVEAVALIALLVGISKAPSNSRQMWLAGAAAICLALMIGLWAAWIRPLNAAIAGWAPDDSSDDWTRHQQRWSAYHRRRLVLAVVALALLLMGVLPRAAS